MKRHPGVAAAVLAVACGGPPPPPCVPDPPPVSDLPRRNVVLIVMDDLGVDKLGVYDVSPRPAATPRLDALATGGLRFTSAYAEPVCSPGRAALLTGRRPRRTGVGSNVRADHGLPDREVLIPEALSETGWSSAAIGKWHLSAFEDGPSAPNQQGFDHFDGLLANANKGFEFDGPLGYDRWERITDGEVALSEEYLLTAQTEAAIDALATLPEPFFLYVAYSGAHLPLHIPPDELWSEADLVGAPGIGDAMIEALDHEIGRLVDAIGDRATVIVTSDNGTAAQLLRPPADLEHGKLSVYSGGSHVPLIVVGPEVVPGVSEELVHVTDLFPTVLDLAGVDPSSLGIPLDGTSLVPLFTGAERASRRCLFLEHFLPLGVPDRHQDVAVMDDRYALVRSFQEADELYVRDPLAAIEGDDLLRSPGPLDDAAHDALQRFRDQLRHDL